MRYNALELILFLVLKDCMGLIYCYHTVFSNLNLINEWDLYFLFPLLSSLKVPIEFNVWSVLVLTSHEPTYELVLHVSVFFIIGWPRTRTKLWW